MVRILVDEVFTIKNYSTSCMCRAHGWATHPIIKEIIKLPTSDTPYANLLQAYFKIQGWQLVSTLKDVFYMFNGQIWEIIKSKILEREVMSISNNLLNLLSRTVVGEEDYIKNVKKSLNSGLKYVNKISSVKNIVTAADRLFVDIEIENKLDSNPDIIACKNGIIDLRTGQLRAGRIDDYISKQIEYEYQGINHHTTDIDNFMNDIFNNDIDTINYLQKLLGYAITGNQDVQCWAIFTGTGSNGKGVLLNLLRALLGEYYLNAPDELFFESDIRKRAGQAEPHLLLLQKKRISATDELPKGQTLNFQFINRTTGEGPITARDLYSKSDDYITFMPTHFPILVCNDRPEINIKDYPSLRRIKVIPFNNTYASPDDLENPLDLSNKDHRPKNSNLKKFLLDDLRMEQFLTWLVKGSVKWYENGLGKVPSLIDNAFKAYKKENDLLAQFIEEYCVINSNYRISATSFGETFRIEKDVKITQKDLVKLMKEKKFKYDTYGARTFKGIKMKEDNNSTQEVDELEQK